MNDLKLLIKKYDVPVPRYTSYPTVPHWDTASFSEEKWIASVTKSFAESNEEKGISLYIHLPFCESLCTYCACNTRITRNHRVEIDYIRAVLKEWDLYRNVLGKTPVIRELHLGGGTPTFFSPQNLHWLVSCLLDGVIVHPDHEFSFEGHPNNTTEAHLMVLRDLGFRRVSFGVQDLDLKVQETINRIQPFENVENATSLARRMGYSSINFDLIYGLPFQTVQTIESTIQKVLMLKPERISFYSYAHVPWIRPGQRGYEDADLPSDVMKRSLYEAGRKLLRDYGYEDIGMDHFSLPHDALYIAQQNGKLHRNFMGYTATDAKLLIGLGTSAISDTGYSYAQNIKKVEDYVQALENNRAPVAKGHIQTEEDLLAKQCILDVSCSKIIRQENLLPLFDTLMADALNDFCNEGVLVPDLDGFYVTQKGRIFIRNICSVFDLRLKRRPDRVGNEATFSMAI